MSYVELQETISVLGLGERATMREIKARHRELVKQHHPDAGAVSEPVEIRKINAAYRILMDYVADYRFSFDENEFYEQNPEERIRRQFMDDPLWGR
jgi:curved DNA-binding protein CbpA